jgi:predicted GIY-YIG superfamily endonuclease
MVDIILQHAYHHPTLRPPKLSEELMKQLLLTCTTETPFRHINGDIYLQTDGVSMGSPLGPLMANFYMASIENSVMDDMADNEKPLVYCRYVDDIFLIVNNIKVLENLKSKFEAASVLNFTFEIENNHILTFLDVDVNKGRTSLTTSVHVKSTHSGDCLNYHSIAPEQYKVGVVTTMLNRAYTICSEWDLFHAEVLRLQQLFTNNNFPSKLVDDVINKFLNRKFEEQINSEPENKINLYYRSQMSSQYKMEEKNIRKILEDNVTPRDGSRINLSIYYRSRKLSSLLITNNLCKDSSNSHVVYRYTCNFDRCQPSQFYIGYTQTTLKQRMTTHAQNGSIQAHHKDAHSLKIKTADIMENITIMHRSQDKMELLIAEALYIKQEQPPLNNQREGETRILHIF